MAKKLRGHARQKAFLKRSAAARRGWRTRRKRERERAEQRERQKKARATGRGGAGGGKKKAREALDPYDDDYTAYEWEFYVGYSSDEG